MKKLWAKRPANNFRKVMVNVISESPQFEYQNNVLIYKSVNCISNTFVQLFVVINTQHNIYIYIHTQLKYISPPVMKKLWAKRPANNFRKVMVNVIIRVPIEIPGGRVPPESRTHLYKGV